MNNDLMKIFHTVHSENNKELEELSLLVDAIIKNQITDEKNVSSVFDRILSVVFVEEDKKRNLFYKLSNYCRCFDENLAMDYERIYREYNFYDDMSYSSLTELLMSSNVYEKLNDNKDKLFALIPELKICDGFEQNNKWHVYDVFKHILHVVGNTEANLCLRVAALFHDIGKPVSYVEDLFGIGHFPNHWNESLKIFLKYQDKFELSENDKELVRNLIFYHDMKIDKMSSLEIDDMIDKIGIENIHLLFKLKRADLFAQSSEYHDLVSDINKQEEDIKKRKLVK